jgi:hypothetical protein
MNQDLFDLHLRAGIAYGEEATCGMKIDYKSEESAERSAKAMTVRYGRSLEAYPCAFCGGWHIGRQMTYEEHEFFKS